MAYPEKGASYKNRPKWVDDMKRAEGGTVDDLKEAHNFKESLRPDGLNDWRGSFGEKPTLDEMAPPERTRGLRYMSGILNTDNAATGTTEGGPSAQEIEDSVLKEGD